MIVAERDGKIHLQCEDGEEHAIAITHRSQLVSVTPPADELPLLVAAIQGRRSASAARALRAAKKAAAKPKVPKGPRLTFEQQVERYTTGFAGPQDPALEKARMLLSADALGSAQGFENMQTLVGSTTLLHPMEGQIPLRAIPESHRAPIAHALRDVLHGNGDYAPRFEAYVATFSAAKAEGAAKGPSWPLTTLLPALYAPAEHAFIKPKLFQEQAKILNLPIDYVSLPNGVVYDQFRAVLRAVEGKLKEAGQKPRDLMDVATFVWTSLSAEAPAVEGAPVVEAQA